MLASQRPPRPHRADFDALRVLGVLTVALVHCAQVFSPWQYWHIQNTERSAPLAAFTFAVWPWIMPLFMYLAGIGAWYSLGHRTARDFLHDRTLRVLAPLTFGTVLLVPPQVYVERLAHRQFHGTYIDFIPHFFDGVYPAGNLSAGQFWFLAYLYAYLLITLPLFVWLRRNSSAPWLVRLERRLARPAAFLLLPALPLAASQVALRGRFPVSLAFYNDWAHHALLLTCYVYGWLLMMRPGLQTLVTRYWLIAAWLALAGTTWLVWLILRLDGLLPRPWSGPYLLTWFIFGSTAWFCLVALAGAAQQFVRVRSRVLEFGAAIALPFYLLHQTVLALLAYRVVPLSAPISAKFLLLAGASIALTLLVIEVASHNRVARVVLGLRRRPVVSLSGSRSAEPCASSR